jgi:uncharacterized membrane protein
MEFGPLGIQPMTTKHSSPQTSAVAAASPAADALSDHINQNIESILAFHEREQRNIGHSARRLDGISSFIGRPIYLISLLSLVVLWIAANALARSFGLAPFDPPPFSGLQGLLTFAALLTATIVLIAQNRQAKLENQRDHLELQVNLLTEQKVTKLIHLLEELRHDLPMVKDRHDPESASLQRRTDTAQVLSALKDVGVVSDWEKFNTRKPSATGPRARFPASDDH